MTRIPSPRFAGCATLVFAATVATTLLATRSVDAAGDPPPAPTLQPQLSFPAGVRFATFNASLNRSAEGELVQDLTGGGDAQARIIAELIQRTQPDVLLINEFDFVADGSAVDLIREAYLALGQTSADGVDPAVPMLFDHVFVAPSNTGIPSGFDLDNSGGVGGPNDAFGFGFFPGQFGMVLLSRHPIAIDDVRTFQTFLWRDMPGALLPDDPSTPEPADWFSPDELDVVRLSSKSHWDVPIVVGDRTIHVLASHPTPPVFDGPEDRNGRRNHDEIRFWADYVNPAASAYVYDDDGVRGGLPSGASFIVMGDLNADPSDGDSTMDAARQLTDNAAFNRSLTPSSPGGVEQAGIQGGANDDHAGDPAFDTADFADGSPGSPGNLRVDYALPSADLPIAAAGVLWPRADDPLFELVGTFPFPSSDHRLVYVDLAVDGRTMPGGLAVGDVDVTRATLRAATAVPGSVRFEWALDSRFDPIAGMVEADASIPAGAKATIFGLEAGTRYFVRAIDAAGSVATATFSTSASLSDRTGLRFGVTGDWRGELAPYPAIGNADERDLDFFIELGDTIYADFESPVLPGLDQARTPLEFALKHAEVIAPRFGLAAWRDLHATTPIYATIDDHEVTNDFSGGAPPSSDPRFAGEPGAFINQTPFYRAGVNAFVNAKPLEDLAWSGTGDPLFDGVPDLYRTRTFGADAALFVLDARSFRDPPLPPVVDLTDPAAIAAFIIASFDPTRTMLGDLQVQRLQADLVDAENAGVTWKFIVVPEPVQNLGVAAASDRFEGYSAERTRILQFIDELDIRNVVFIAADIHGTVINDVRYQTEPFGPQIELGALEVTTGSVAFDAPFGPTVAQLALAAGLLTAEEFAFYESLPAAAQDAFVQQLIDAQLIPLGYTPVGLDDASLDASLLDGGWSATHGFGWTEFEIDRVTRDLTVTTWGIEPYTRDDLRSLPESVSSRQPSVASRFVVRAAGFCLGDVDGGGTVDFDDLLRILAEFGGTDASADLNDDGTVDTDDLLLVIANWGPCS